MSSVNKPTVLITGAGRGLGKQMALAFAKKGYLVGIHYFKSATDAQQTYEEILHNQGEAKLFTADVGDSIQVNAMFKEISSNWGRLDVLVNNAGITRDRTLFKMSDEEWRDVMRVNLDGSFYCVRAALPLMRNQKSGSIINIISYVAPRGVRGGGNYAVSKAGLTTLTKNVAIEEGSNGIRANAIMPGFHLTDMNKTLWERYEKIIRDQHMLAEMPRREELGEFVVSIAELKTVSGQVFSFESRN